MAESKASNCLIGQFFHTFDAERILERQGFVLGSPEPGYYLCLFYDFYIGAPNCAMIFNIDDMTSWAFYTDEEQWRRAYEATRRGGDPTLDPAGIFRDN